MENASKALLISGGILIVIVLIAVGLNIFDSTKDSADGELETSSQVIDSTNSAAQSASSAMQALNHWIK